MSFKTQSVNSSRTNFEDTPLIQNKKIAIGIALIFAFSVGIGIFTGGIGLLVGGGILGGSLAGSAVFEQVTENIKIHRARNMLAYAEFKMQSGGNKKAFEEEKLKNPHLVSDLVTQFWKRPFPMQKKILNQYLFVPEKPVTRVVDGEYEITYSKRFVVPEYECEAYVNSSMAKADQIRAKSKLETEFPIHLF